MLKYLGLTLDDMEAIITGTRDALDGQCLTREELADAVAEKTGKPQLREKMRSGWGSLLKPAAYHGYLCFGPNRGTNVTFVRPDQWIGAWQEYDPQEALLEVARRHPQVLTDPEPMAYFTEFGTNALQFELHAYTDIHNNRLKVRDELQIEISKVLHEKGITIPFPQMDVHIKTDAGRKAEPAGGNHNDS